VWGFPWIPATFVIASVTIVINRLVSEPLDSALGLALVALGVPAYYLWARRVRSELQLETAAVAHDRR
jgi:APA family basic amino acid/polyamine antiporter